MTSSFRRDVIFAGDAGQGILTAAIHFARAASEAGHQVAQSSRYGSATRSGQVIAGVIVSDEAIDYPIVEEPDLLVTMSVDGARLALRSLKDNGTILTSGFLFAENLPRGIGLAPESSATALSAETLVAAVMRLGRIP